MSGKVTRQKPAVQSTAKVTMPQKGKVRRLNWRQLAIPVIILLIGAGTSLYIVRHAQTSRGSNANTPKIVDCSSTDKASDFKCWESRLRAITQNQSPEAAFTDIKAAYAKNPYVVSQCHQLVHRIGRQAVERYPDVSDAFKHGDNFCWSGYYHGVMEAVSAKLGYNGVVNGMNDICAKVRTEQKYSFYHYNCVHGLGHGVMGITNNQLFDSLKICDKLADSWEAQSCYGGVFMENVMSEDNPDHRTAYLHKDDPMYPCTAVDAKYKGQCYLMQSSYALKLDGYDFTKVFPQCAAVDADFVATCYQSIGRDASGNSVSDVVKTNATCMLGQDLVAQSNCVIGAVKDFISYFHSDVQAKQFCASFADADLQSTCTTTAIDYYKSF